MKDESKPKKQLICELMEYRQRVAKLEASEALYKKVNENTDLLSYSKSQAKPDQCVLRENTEIVEYLKKSRLFSHLPERILEQLLPLSHLEDYPSGSEILKEGATNTKVFFLIRGAVSVYAGGNRISDLRRKGDIFGEMSIISNKPCSASIIAETPVRLFSIKAKHIGEYTDIETSELENILYRIFAMILTDKLSLTNKKAQRYEAIHDDLLREIDDRKLVEEKLQKAKSTLEKRVEERTSELKATNENLHREIEERRQAEDEIRKSEEKYRLIAENMSDVISVMDMDFRFTYVSPSIKRLTGYTVEEAMKHSVEEIMTPESFKRVSKAFEEEIMLEASGTANPSRTRIIEFEQNKQDLEIVWVEASCSFLRDIDRKPTGILIISRDISDRKQSELERERLMAAIEQSGDAIVVTDINGVITYVNPAFQKVSGYTWQEAINLNPRLLKSGHQDKLFYQQLWETILSGRTWSGRMVNKKKDGSFYTEDATISPVFDTSGKIINFVAVKRDVTEHLMLSTQLQQAQKMESIGTLAGGIAHDFNNILSALIGFTELALDDVEKGSPIEDSLQEIYAGGKRARDLVKQILAFARQSDDKIKPIQIDTIVKEVLKLLRASIPTTIRIDQDIKKEITIMGNPTQVHQILMNICTNAAQSMEENGGILGVSIKDIVIDKIDALGNLKPGNYAQIKISDTGIGIDPENMNKIFDPYFTTKETGKGTGMGLALAHGIIQTYKGTITAESIPGKGTVFTVCLPSIRDRRESDMYQPEILPTGNERILLVDDETPIVKMSSQILQKLGYDVVFRTSSLNALELFRANPDDFDLVITDMTMPDMTGDKLAAELMSIRRDIPVILCTGYSNKISDKIAAAIGIQAFAYKPVSKADLANTVRKVLDEVKNKN